MTHHRVLRFRPRALSGSSRRRSVATLVALSLLAVSCTDLRDPVGVQRPSAPSFSVAPADLSYVGDADDLETGGIQLTIPLGGTAGAAWLLGVQRVNDGFESEFTFQVEPGTTYRARL